MGDQLKPDTPSIIKSIIEEASLPKKDGDNLQKLNRQQLLELFMYLREVKKTNKGLKQKLDTLLQQGNDDENHG